MWSENNVSKELMDVDAQNCLNLKFQQQYGEVCGKRTSRSIKGDARGGGAKIQLQAGMRKRKK